MTKSKETSVKKGKKVRNIPFADADLSDLAINVDKSWLANPPITLIWLTRADFNIAVTTFSNLLIDFMRTSASRPEITMKLKLLDKEINRRLERIKTYLAAKYSDGDVAMYYAAFGMINYKSRYILPNDRDDRLEALKNLIKSITTHGFQDKEFGLAYWTGIHDNYETLWAKAKAIDGKISKLSGQKNKLKTEIKTALNALINVLKANYPKTYKSVLRSWGFQKEKY
jgi:hypothetical protein